MTTDDDDTPLTPAQEQATLDAIDAAWVASPDATDRVRRLFLAKLAAKYPDHPWVATLPEPSQQARDFLAARQGDSQFWRLLAALRDAETKEKGE
ncbi:MAG TPA: hypothetical protein VMV29_14725 [Ktedonobacterales bacterium]|nr:hypothetical protein [Ktedonobacterales bacterium]